MTDNDEFLEIFKAESEKNLAIIEKGVTDLLGQNSKYVQVREIFRAAHTLKGSARMMGFDAISQVAAALEEFLESVADKQITLSPAAGDALLQAASWIRRSPEMLPENSSDLPRVKDILDKLKAAR